MSSSDVRTAGTLGLVGSVLLIIPYTELIGAILVLIALNKLSKG